MPTCTVCKGKKKITLTIHSYEGKGKTTSSSSITCIHCDGTGTLSQAQVDQIEWEKTQWCGCTTQHPSDFFEDGEHPDCHKHHYRCTHCSLITQIG